MVMNDYSNYLEMQKKFYDNSDIPSKDIVGYYEWNELFPYETQLLFKNGDLRFPIYNDFNDKVALDFACGPGRMIKRMSHLFSRVDGVDIAPRLIEEAKGECPTSEFYISSGDNLGDAPVNTYDFVYSTIAMQHIAVRSVRLNILENIQKVLKEGAYVTVQMAFSKDFPYNKTLSHYDQNGLRIRVKMLDNTHAGWLEERTKANQTNSGCDVGIGPEDVPFVIEDFQKYFKNVNIWFYDYSIFGINPYEIKQQVFNEGSNYWPTHFIFINAQK
jgi:SAM-dependent methyltransferase